MPIDPRIAKNEKNSIIGIDVGDDFSNYQELREIGREVLETHGLKSFTEVGDRVCTRISLRMINPDCTEGLIHTNSAIGFSGRAIMSGRKPEYVLEGIIQRISIRIPMNGSSLYQVLSPGEQQLWHGAGEVLETRNVRSERAVVKGVFLAEEKHFITRIKIPFLPEGMARSAGPAWFRYSLPPIAGGLTGPYQTMFPRTER